MSATHTSALAHTLLAGRRRRLPAPVLPIPGMGEIALAPARLHEACGPARHRFAMWLAAAGEGPVLWVMPQWQRMRLNPDGMAELASPARFTFIAAERAIDLLWCMEEALRTGCVPLVVGELPELPSLTQVRRLHLASEIGAQAGVQPLGLILTPGDGGAPGVESRWHIIPAHCDGQARWRLCRRRARTAPVKDWLVSQGSNSLQAISEFA